MKLYVREDGAPIVRRHVRVATVVATSQVAYPEARAAFARRRREGALTERQIRGVVRDFDADLDAYAVVALTAGLARRAGALAETRALRGFDAIHLASALEIAALTGEVPGFCCFDDRLAAAATAEGLTVVPTPRVGLRRQPAQAVRQRSRLS